jgi:hypothetical protein
MNMQKYLTNLKLIEVKNSKILTISHALSQNLDWQVLVRPLGISVLVKTSGLSTITSQINMKLIDDERRLSSSLV